MGEAHAYATAIMHRGRNPMEPVDHVPDWVDGPRKGKLYPGTDTVPLPDGDYPAAASLRQGLGLDPRPPATEPDGFDLRSLGGMLRDSYGLTGRRLGVQANSDLAALPHYRMANWSRGTASGGGLYPVSVYWVSGASGPLTPGVHYYSTARHTMQRLLTGDVSARVRDALGDSAPGPPTDQYLVLGVKFWQNAFKYNSFSFHVVSMDFGALLGTWRMWARARGLEVEPALWFDERRLAELLGVGPLEEGVFAVVPLRWADTGRRRAAPAASRVEQQAADVAVTDVPAAPSAALDAVAVAHRDVERSRRVSTFDAVTTMQRLTSAHATERPAAAALAAAVPPAPDRELPRVALPEPEPLETDVRTALRARRSSFGRFDRRLPLSAPQLSACLAAAAAGGSLGGDTEPPAEGPALTGLYVFVSHVEGVEPGAYAYDAQDPEGPSLRRITAGNAGAFLQRNYFLSNYNLEQAGAVLVSTARVHAVLDATGDRGYRLANSLIGSTAQATYTACAALDIGCGVALGFDNVSYTEELGLEERGESPLLIMMVGRERTSPADFRYELA
ncbi:nitroreductase family protein [Streptomyces otsuchiensis]|uniref:nitroreductase family protein n=1 Tax=Streptomyces otsuchiensis TaxID=2681388 RepID=UPI001030D32D|nr:nitroreductase family protein [Streptomyces otsuchiensis]